MGNELIDRDRLDQIIRRATELQTGEREIGEGLTEDDLIQLGADVGIPARYLRQALLEDRTRGTRSQVRGAGQALVGPTTVEVNRVVLGDLHDVAEGVDQWMIEDEGLSTIRNTVQHLIYIRGLRFLNGWVRAELIGAVNHEKGDEFGSSLQFEVGTMFTPRIGMYAEALLGDDFLDTDDYQSGVGLALRILF